MFILRAVEWNELDYAGRTFFCAIDYCMFVWVLMCGACVCVLGWHYLVLSTW